MANTSRYILVNFMLALALLQFGCTENTENSSQDEETEIDQLLGIDEDQNDPQKELSESGEEIVSPQRVHGGYLTGMVSDENGTPLANAQIYPLGDPTNIVFSDEKGKYQFPILSEIQSSIRLIAIKDNTIDGRSLGVLSDEIDLETANKSQNDSDLTIDLVLTPTGNIKGKVILIPDIEDRSGIDVYFPGTGFIAKTDADGMYHLSGIPEGKWDIRADFDGYSSAEAKGIEIESNQTNTAEPLKLFLSNGPQFELTPENNAYHITSEKVTLQITYSPKTTLMRITTNEAIASEEWSNVSEEITITLPKQGLNIIYAQFADRNGLESIVKKINFFYNDRDEDNTLDSDDCSPDDPLLFQELSYSYIDQDLDGFFKAQQGTLCTGSDLPPVYKIALTEGEVMDCDDLDPALNASTKGYLDDDEDGYGFGGEVDFCIAEGAFPSGYQLNNQDDFPPRFRRSVHINDIERLET